MFVRISSLCGSSIQSWSINQSPSLSLSLQYVVLLGVEAPVTRKGGHWDISYLSAKLQVHRINACIIIEATHESETTVSISFIALAMYYHVIHIIFTIATVDMWKITTIHDVKYKRIGFPVWTNWGRYMRGNAFLFIVGDDLTSSPIYHPLIGSNRIRF